MYIPLYEINAKLAEAFDEETGELLISEEELDEIFENEKKGVDYFIALYKNSSATGTAFDEEAKALAKRAKAYQRIAERAFKTLDKHMAGSTYESTVGKIAYRKSTKCEQTDEMAFLKWDERFSYGSTEFKPAVKEIKMAISSGKEIPGWANNEYINMNIK